MDQSRHPAFHLIGNAHLDPAWMWPLEEGFEAFLATCRSALLRMDETPGFIFTASSAAHYEFVKQTDPDLFIQIQNAVKRGKWAIVGGWWVESDCNLPSGETLIRQGLYGQQYFLSQFGVTCHTGYCIDSFGHQASIPQILRHCGMQHYVFMRPEEHEKHLPGGLFQWKAPSRDRVTAFRIPLHYSNHRHSVKEKIDLLASYPLYSPLHSWMIFYGVGNHGGGPTKEQIQQILSEQQHDPGIIFSSPDMFFDDIKKSGIELPVISDEMQPHAIGCYSAYSQIKQLHRRAENALLRAEKISLMAESCIDKYCADRESFRQAWKNILLNSFHDTLGGVAIPEASEEAIALYYESLAIARRQERTAIQVISNSIGTTDSVESLLLYNPHSWKIKAPVEFELWHPEASEKGESLSSLAVTDRDGNHHSVQKIESLGKIGGDRVRFTFEADVPAFGWTGFTIERNAAAPPLPSNVTVREHKLSNGICGIVFAGEAGRNEILYSAAQVYEDESDTWGHGITGYSEKRGLFKVDSITVIEKGPIRGRVRVESSYGNSSLEEEFILYNNSDYIEQRIYLDWRKKHSVLKLRYKHSCIEPRVHYEIPYGVIERAIGSAEVPGNSWAFISDDHAGIGILNDAKYSYSSDEKYFYITAARSPLYAHHSPPHSISSGETLRYIDQGEQEFGIRIVFGKKNWQEAEMPKRTLEFLQPSIAHIESSHSGGNSTEQKIFSVSMENILITALKHCHDETRGIIIRAVESFGIQSHCVFEYLPQSLSWEAEFTPYQIKTFKISEAKVIETNGLEEILTE